MRRRSVYLKSGGLSEESLHRQVAAFLRLALPRGCGVMWMHTPNGGKRPRGEAGKLKAMGAKPGVLDFYFRWRAGVGWIELKSERGRLSDDQRAFITEAEALGDLCMVATTIEAVEGTLRAWLPPGILRATLMPGGSIRVHDLRVACDSSEMPPTPSAAGRAARSVSPGEPWTFADHRTLAEVQS